MAFEWIDTDSELFLKRGYVPEGSTIENRIIESINNFGTYFPNDKKKFREYFGAGFYSLSSPVWSNYGTTRGLPISCFGSYVPDNIPGIFETVSEIAEMSKLGGGTSAYFGDVRSRGALIKNGLNGTSNGSVNFMRVFDTVIDVVSQGTVRRGMMAAYLDITHNDFWEFIEIGTEGHPIQLITTGVCVSDEFMEELSTNKEYQKRWAKLLKTRAEIGYPYIVFTGTANKHSPYTGSKWKIRASNLCSEIMLPSNEDESFVCVLSSMNVAKYDEWKNTDAVKVLTKFLNTVIFESVKVLDSINGKEKELMSRAINFMTRHRAIGIGVLGFADYIQEQGWSWYDQETAKFNVEVFKHIQEESYKASEELYENVSTLPIKDTSVQDELGLKRYNTTTMAIAPTKSSSFIMGKLSQGIEPIYSNYFVMDLAKTKVVYKNPRLIKILNSLGKNTKEVWDSILKNDGSVQHLDFLDEHQKEVFLTFKEIDPIKIVELAGIRQNFIDQGQSLNIMISNKLSDKDIHKIHMHAYHMGVKSLYYQKAVNAAQDLYRECTACSS